MKPITDFAHRTGNTYPYEEDGETEEWLEKPMTLEEQRQQEEAQRIWYKDRKPGDYFPI